MQLSVRHSNTFVAGLEINEARPADKLPYRGAWLWLGEQSALCLLVLSLDQRGIIWLTV